MDDFVFPAGKAVDLLIQTGEISLSGYSEKPLNADPTPSITARRCFEEEPWRPEKLIVDVRTDSVRVQTNDT